MAARGAGAAMARGSTGNAMKGITEWLASIGLSEYAQRFADNAIDLSVIRDLTEQDLKDLGVLLGHRRKILRAITELPAAPAPEWRRARSDTRCGCFVRATILAVQASSRNSLTRISLMDRFQVSRSAHQLAASAHLAAPAPRAATPPRRRPA